MNRKYIFIFIVIAVIGVIFFLFGQKFNENTYSNSQYHFSFNYPKDFTVLEEKDPRGMFTLILRIYSSENYKKLDECNKKYPGKDEQLLNCGQVYSNFQISAYDSVNVDYNKLDDWAKSNYPEYLPLTIGNLDAFSYTTNSIPKNAAYLINFPDKKFGLEFETDKNNKEDQKIIEGFLSTFKFTQ